MTKKFQLAFLAILLTHITQAQNNLPYSQRMANSQMLLSGNITTWDYPNGLFVESIMKVYHLYKEEAFYNYALKHANATTNSTTGKIGASFKFTDYNLDYINPGKFLFEVYKVTPYKHHKIALDTLRKQLQFQPRTNYTSDGGFWHKLVYPHQMWLDGLFMGTRFYAAYEKEFNSGAGYDDIVNQFKLIHSKTYDPQYQLNYHAWSALPSDANSFWANKADPFIGCSKEFWGRGMGWYAAALVDVIEILPKEYGRRQELIAIFHQVAAGIKRWQDPSSGCWYQLLRYDSTFKSAKGKPNYIEASASSMFTYALLKALRLEIIEKSEYQNMATKAYNGLLSNFITEDTNGRLSLNRICRSAGLGPASNPSRDGSASYYLDGSDAGSIVSNDLKGVGPFIMASIEFEIMQTSLAKKANIAFLENDFRISCKNGTLSITSSSEQIQTVQVYSLDGNLIFREMDIKKNKYAIALNSEDKLMLIRINNRYSQKVCMVK